MTVSGVVMRLVQPGNDLSPQDAAIAPAAPCPNIEATYIMVVGDYKVPSFNTIYFLRDVSPVTSSSSAYDEDVRTHGSELASISWVVCAFINGRDKPNSKGSARSANIVTTRPVNGSVVVVNGSTPKPDKEQDYHDWYDQEHGEKLTLVPGWNSARRYGLAKVYGDVQTASFYGFNFYDEENGLGGPE